MTENISRMKLVHQLIPTRALLCPRKQESTSKCLRCNLVSKTHDYVIRCQWSQKLKAHKDTLSSLQCKLRKHNNSPLIIHAVTALITETTTQLQRHVQNIHSTSGRINAFSMRLSNGNNHCVQTHLCAASTHETRCSSKISTKRFRSITSTSSGLNTSYDPSGRTHNPFG